MSLAALFGKLQEHEIELARLEQHEARGGQRSVMGGFGLRKLNPKQSTVENSRPNFTQMKQRLWQVSVNRFQRMLWVGYVGWSQHWASYEFLTHHRFSNIFNNKLDQFRILSPVDLSYQQNKN